MEGEDVATDDPRSFASAARWKRFLILIAGTVMNFLTGLIILICLFSSTIHPSNVIAGFADGCPAADYLCEGDEILRIDGHIFLTTDDVSMILERGNGSTADFVVRRDGVRIVLKDVPIYLAEYTEDGVTTIRYGLNFAWDSTGILSNTSYALRSSLDFARMVWYGLEELFTGGASVSDLSGPIGIVDTMSEVASASSGWLEAVLNLLYLGSFIAINLAVMNLLPIPALDGGRLLFLILNGILAVTIHRQIPAKYESWVHMAGMILLLTIMLLVGVQDVLRLIGD